MNDTNENTPENADVTESNSDANAENSGDCATGDCATDDATKDDAGECSTEATEECATDDASCDSA